MTSTTDTSVRTDGDHDVVALLRRQHDLLRHLMEEVATGTPPDRPTAFEAFLRLAAVHETAEEIVVYPVVRRCGAVGESEVELRTAEEDEAKKRLSELESMAHRDGDELGVEFLAAFAEIRTAIEQHALAEEQEVFPLLEAQVSAQERQSMGRAVEAAEAVAPTHPHAGAPESALGNMVVGPFVAVVDRVRDVLRDRNRTT